MVGRDEKIEGEVVDNLNFKEISTAWAAAVARLGALRVPTSEAEHARLVELLDGALDATREVKDHPLGGLIDLLSDLIEVYETRAFGDASAPPAEVLRLLMESNGMRQSDLAAELGGQSVVSAILSGAREINARQAGALAARFGVSAAAFIQIPSHRGSHSLASGKSASDQVVHRIHKLLQPIVSIHSLGEYILQNADSEGDVDYFSSERLLHGYANSVNDVILPTVNDIAANPYMASAFSGASNPEIVQ